MPPGSKVSKEAEAELEEIYDEQGELTEDAILKKAKLKNSALHDYFEWDNSKAAEAYRRQQARGVIASVTVVTVDNEGKEARHRVYESTWDPESADPMPAWRRREDIVQDQPDLLIRTMEREWKGFLNRWGDQPGFWPMIDAARPKPKSRGTAA
jgi:hypothetical protein